MMKVKYSIYIIYFFITYSCSNPNKYDRFLQFKSEVYPETFKEFPVQGINDYKNIKYQVIFNPSGYEFHDFSAIFLYQEIKNYDTIFMSLKARNKKFDIEKLRILNTNSYENKIDNGLVYIPKLPEDFVHFKDENDLMNNLILFDYQNGVFINEIDNDSNQNSLHGFSSGAYRFPSESLIIYWILIW